MKQIIYILVLFLYTIGIQAQTVTQNYILTRTYQEADASRSIDIIQYFDGLGHPIETVQKSFTPLGKDFISTQTYDAVGREFQKWSPAPSANSDGSFVDLVSFRTTQKLAYNDNNPYTQTNYEPSPLNRITGQFGTGAAWYTNNKKDSVIYQANSANEVKLYYINSTDQLAQNDYYANATLYKTINIDEDGKISADYKDKQGRVVMKRNSSNVDTYYVYNDLGQLCYVLPPLAADALVNGTFDDNNTPALIKYAYLYKYDNRGNNIVKRLPGCDYIYMVYDKANRLVLSQDGNQRNNGNWTQTCYDAFGRILYTYVINTAANHGMLISAFSNILQIDTFTSSPPSDTVENTGYSLYPNSSLRYLKPSVPGGPIYHPTYINTSLVQILLVNYYDNYNFLSLQTDSVQKNLTYTGPYSDYDDRYDASSPYIEYDPQYYSVDNPDAKGLLTGIRIYNLDKTTGPYLTKALYYDYKGQLVQSRSTNYLGGYDRSYNAYSFSGKIKKNLKEHNILGKVVIPEIYTYTYDNAGRLINTTYQINNKNFVLASNTYDELGRLNTKSRHNQNDLESYTYNIRNWPTKIKSGTFEENVYYDSNPIGTTPCFNGNISYSTWTYNNVSKGYAYNYDELNRLKDATFKQGTSTQGDGYFNENFTYDAQGNILTLKRAKDNVLIDDLVFTPDGNQLKSISDARGSQNQYSIKEYNNKSTATTDEFSYDKNGNIIKDLDRDIVTIRYNILNLPDTIQFKNGNQIINRYSADGRKLGTEYYTCLVPLSTPVAEGTTIRQTYTPKVVDQNGTVCIENKEYSTSKGIYTNTVLSRVNNHEGFVTFLGIDPRSYYNRKDHLGNIREVWAARFVRTPLPRGGSYQPAQAATIQQTQYYPSGLPWAEGLGASQQPYKYNGKEFVEMSGYDMYDYGARGYFAASGRFTSIDPLCEKHPNISPYAYCNNNPVNNIDPLGLDTVNVNTQTPIKTADVMVENDKTVIGTASIDEAKVTLPKSDPYSNFDRYGHYHLYTQNETKAATDIMLGVAVAVLSGGTGLAAGIGEETVAVGTKVISDPLSTIPFIQVVAGAVEGTVKSIFGPDPESSSSIFMNPISDKSMNATELFWNTWTISKGSNPLPNP